MFNAYSSHYHRKGGYCKSYANQIDFFGIYCSELNAVYLVPIGHTARVSGSLRVYASRNGQQSRVRWAQPYLISVEAVPEVIVGTEATDAVAEPIRSSPS